MASLPIIPASWRHSEQSQTPSPTSEEPAASSPVEDRPSPDSLSQSPVLIEVQSQQSAEPSATETTPLAPEACAEELERCWICQMDASEDEVPREWLNPCSCSLTAHNDCLLEWVSSEEAPRNGGIGGRFHSQLLGGPFFFLDTALSI